MQSSKYQTLTPHSHPYIIWIIYLIVFSEALLSILFFPEEYAYQADTNSFLAAWAHYKWTAPLSWIDTLRTPVYPLFYGFCDLFRFMPVYRTAILLQWIVFAISAKYFMRLCNLFISSSTIRILVSFIYVLYPGFYECNDFILSESLSMSMMIFMLYTVARLSVSGHIRYALWSTLWLTILLLLKPAMIFLIPILLVGWIIYLRKNKRTAVAGISSTLIASIVLGVYMTGFSHKYGWFASSAVSDFNIEFNLRFWDLDNLPYDDPALTGAAGDGAEPLKDLTPQRRHELIASNLLQVRNEYFSRSIKNILSLWRARAFDWKYIGGPLPIYLTPEMGLICVIMGIYAIMLIHCLIKRAGMSVALSMLICAIWWGNFIVVWFGAFCYEGTYARLMQPVAPLFLIVAGQISSLFGRKRTINEVLSRS